MLNPSPTRPSLVDIKKQFGDLKLSTGKELVPVGNETLDNILGGGFVKSTVNMLECTNHHTASVGHLIGLTLASSTLSKKENMIIVVCDEVARLSEEEFIADLPLKTKVKSETLYKDLISKSASTRIKIAWRYTNLSSPSDRAQLVEQVDFGVQLNSDKELVSEIKERKLLRLLHLADFSNLNAAMKRLIELVDEAQTQITRPNPFQVGGDRPNVAHTKPNHNVHVNILIMNLLSPFSVVDIVNIPNFLFTLRSLTRCRKNCTCLLTIYSELILCSPFPHVLGRLYNLSDSTLKLTSIKDHSQSQYADHDGILEIVKIGKINTVAYHYERDVCDWGFRRTKNNRFLVFDKLSLPPCDDSKSKEGGSDVDSSKEINNQSPCSQLKPNKLEF